MLCAVRVPLCVSGIVRAVHQSSSKLRDTPLVRLDLFESLPSRGGLAVEPLQQTLQQNRALHRSTTQAVRHAADVQLYSATALYSSTSLQLYSALHSTSSTPSLRSAVFCVEWMEACVRLPVIQRADVGGRLWHRPRGPQL